MRDIYKHAQRVIAWLGPADEHSPIAIAMLGELADCVDFTNKEDDILDNRITFKPDKKDVKDVYRDALVQASTYHQDLKLMSLCDSASKPT
ncbi:heterokaryon incompatibility protein [Fusarium coicis]|nr:heterokaryon incompatibility protein [Fusarium coicis]